MPAARVRRVVIVAQTGLRSMAVGLRSYRFMRVRRRATEQAVAVGERVQSRGRGTRARGLLADDPLRAAPRRVSGACSRCGTLVVGFGVRVVSGQRASVISGRRRTSRRRRSRSAPATAPLGCGNGLLPPPWTLVRRPPGARRRRLCRNGRWLDEPAGGLGRGVATRSSWDWGTQSSRGESSEQRSSPAPPQGPLLSRPGDSSARSSRARFAEPVRASRKT